MSCKHGNWPPCDECDADDVLYMRIQNLENECADWTKGYGLLFKQNGQLRDLIELIFSSTMPYDKSGQPTFSDAVVNLWSNLNQVDSAGPSACYDEPQPAPGAGDQVQMILKHRLMRKVEGDWLAASEFMTGEPDPSWLAKTEESPEEWRIEQGRRVSGEQIQAGLTRAFASWKKPAPAGEYPPLPEPALKSTQCDSTMRYTTLHSFSEDQMRAYIDADRAMRAAQPAPAAQDDAKDAARWRYAVEIGGNQRMNWLDVYDDWDGDGSFADAIDSAMAADIFGDVPQPSQEPPPIKPMCCRCLDESDDLFPANCSEKPELLTGAPLGMYHCPDCGAMVCAGFPHGPLCQTCHDRKHPGFDCDNTSAADKKEPT